MKHFLLVFVVIGSYLTAVGQVNEDVIYLKNGGILRGTILKSNDSSVVKIEILGGSVFVVDATQIERKALEPVKKLQNKGPITPQSNGFYHQFSLGLPMGMNEYNSFTSGATLNYLLGYQIKQNFKLAAGTGFDNYIYGFSLVPIFARITGDLKSTAVTPFYAADIGYGIGISSPFSNEITRGGLLLFLGGGLQFNTRRSVFYSLSGGYKTQFGSTHYPDRPWEDAYSEYRQFNRIEVRCSLGF